MHFPMEMTDRLRRLAAARRGLPGYGLTAVLFNAIAGLLLLLATAGPAAAQPQARLLLLGDSLTSGYGLAPEQGFAARLGQALETNGYDVEVLNAGVSGDTTAGGRARLGWVLADRPTHAIVELGANDALRGLDPEAAYANLDAILAALHRAEVEVLLAGMYAPPNLGRVYAEEFRNVYARLAEEHDVALYPFFLDGVAAVPELNQADGIHPNAAGVDVLVERILPHVKQLLDEQ